MEPGTTFQPVLSNLSPNDAAKVERVILLSGKLYYDLAKEAASRELGQRVALIRVEELCPFPFAQLRSILQPFASANDIIWIQEEPRNQGAWTHVSERIGTVLESLGLPAKRLRYMGRKESAVPATGVARWHAAEHASLVKGAFEGLQGS